MFNLRKSSGVTLLEIMLVLAVAAMVIVMSIRYYRNASNSQNSNLMLTQINAIIGAAEVIAQGSSTGFAAVNTTNVTGIVGASNMKTPYGSDYTISNPTTTAYSIGWGTIPAQVCSQVTAQITANPKITVTTACSSTGAATVTYNSAT